MSIDESQLQSSRRHFLARNAMGIGGVALTWLLQREGLRAKPVKPEASGDDEGDKTKDEEEEEE